MSVYEVRVEPYLRHFAPRRHYKEVLDVSRIWVPHEKCPRAFCRAREPFLGVVVAGSRPASDCQPCSISAYRSRERGSSSSDPYIWSIRLPPDGSRSEIGAIAARVPLVSTLVVRAGGYLARASRQRRRWPLARGHGRSRAATGAATGPSGATSASATSASTTSASTTSARTTSASATSSRATSSRAT